MIPSGLILGYHGCEASLARSVVLGEQTLEASTNGHDWLGEGIYFWAHDPLRAWEWATASPYRRLSSPAILGAVIDLGNCLKDAIFEKTPWAIRKDIPLRVLSFRHGHER